MFVLAPTAFAGTADNCTCTPSSTTINFGHYDVLAGAPLDGASSFSVTCNNFEKGKMFITYAAKLATSPARALAPPLGDDRLTYQAYVDSARTQPWGDGTGGTFIFSDVLEVPGKGSVTTNPISYYGRIAPGGQDVSATAASYTQTLTITVTCSAKPKP